MAPARRPLADRAPNRRGQGLVEAVVALPVFLLLTWAAFQAFFLGIAQVQLQYAAFCAARAGAVHGGNPEIMERAARRVLAPAPGAGLLGAGSVRCEVIGADTAPSRVSSAPDLLKVRITWDYPLLAPMERPGDPEGGGGPFSLSRPRVRLSASWTTALYAKPSAEDTGKERRGS